jgi:zinc transport system substrate-binding protein
VAALLLLQMVVACERRDGTEPTTDTTSADSLRIRVFVSIPPQRFFLERLGGDLVSVEVLVGPGQSPHSYTPMPKQLVRLSESDLFFRVGVPFEDSLIKKISATMPDVEIVDTRDGIDLQPMESVCTHDDHEHHHHEGGLDPHIWLDPELVLNQARNIAAGLIHHDPEHAATYESNLAVFESELKELDGRIHQELSRYSGRTFYVFHPAFGYFARAYGLRQVAVEQDGKSPTSKHLAALIEQAKAEQVRLILVQPEFPKESAAAVADAIGGAVATVNPLAEDYIANMERIALEISRGFGELSEDTGRPLSTVNLGESP